MTDFIALGRIFLGNVYIFVFQLEILRSIEINLANKLLLEKCGLASLGFKHLTFSFYNASVM